MTAPVDDLKIFETREMFRRWLADNGTTGGGFWMILGKTDSVRTLTAAEALEEALCFGWIDSTIVSMDGDRYRKYFAPRRKGSVWSEKNKKIVGKLTESGRMTEHGLRAVEQAKESGEWYRERDRGVTESQEAGFEELIRGNAVAWHNFTSASPSRKKQFVGYYYEAKSGEARMRRLERITGLLEQNKGLM